MMSATAMTETNSKGQMGQPAAWMMENTWTTPESWKARTLARVGRFSNTKRGLGALRYQRLKPVSAPRRGEKDRRATFRFAKNHRIGAGILSTKSVDKIVDRRPTDRRKRPSR
jgi:hypothetical protein